MPDAPVFTLESANALIPRLNLLLAEQGRRRALIETSLAALARELGETPDEWGPVPDDSPDVAALRAEAGAMLLEYQARWREIEETGAVVKDARRGLLDFYGHVGGQLVWLCWQYGEERVSHYHGLEEGFPRRRPILQADKHRMLN